MKATGIVRRVDDMGRVVIPKEIRREMRIKEGTPMEIFTDKDGSITFKKYDTTGNVRDQLDVLSKAIEEIEEDLDASKSDQLHKCISDIKNILDS